MDFLERSETRLAIANPENIEQLLEAQEQDLRELADLTVAASEKEKTEFSKQFIAVQQVHHVLEVRQAHWHFETTPCQGEADAEDRRNFYLNAFFEFGNELFNELKTGAQAGANLSLKLFQAIHVLPRQTD